MICSLSLLHVSPLHHRPSPTPNPSTHLLHNFTSPFELKQVHAHLLKTNSPLSSLPLSRVASVCAFNSSFSYAKLIFELVDASEVTHWNTCLRSFAEGDSPADAISLFYRLREFDICPDNYTCSFVLKACSRLLDIRNGKIVHGYVEKLGLQSNMFLQNMIVHLYASCGEIGVARKVFDKMPQRDVITSWTSMIGGYAQCGKSKEAIDLFLEMEDAGLLPNEVTVVAVLVACADMGNLVLGRRIHDFSNRSGYEKNIRVCNTLIDMYVKCGCLEDACRIFDNMEERTIVSWSAMIAGLAAHGQAGDALALFNKMINTGVKPNAVTFIGILHACSHMGMVEKGRKYFASMTRDYGIVPRIEHYGCMVDLFSRAGLLQEAHEFIMNMPIAPNGVVWGALLGGCKVHKNIKLAEEATRHLSKLDPLNDGYYVVLSNIYAEAGRWEDVARVRKLMRDRGVKKTPGWSSIMVEGVVHNFVAGDDTHPQTEEISQTWEKLLQRMKLKGYVPNTSVVLLDMEEDQKEKFLYQHSEKLAVVFGLIKTTPGTVIRIMKNLRVCEDCHAALKIISVVSTREIVVRDRNRFHCFKNGYCSCGDYW
uniref:DYW domain-containing protein n=1 Tax=Cucumis melo TaxID=3656 RepID=A0A9I9DX71_CUCME